MSFRALDDDRLIELYEAGWSLRQIGELVEAPYSTVRDHLDRRGVEFRPRGCPHELPHDEYARTAFLYVEMEWSVNEIAEMLGLTHDSVCGRLRKHGVRMRSRGESTRLRFMRRPSLRQLRAMEKRAA